MKKLILLLFIPLISLSSFGQVTSYYNVTTYAGGKKVNIEKKLKRYFGFTENTIVYLTYLDGYTDEHNRKHFKRFSTENKNRCTNYWTIDEDTKKTVLFKLCENEVTPYVEKINYTNKKVSKIVRFYYDD